MNLENAAHHGEHGVEPARYAIVLANLKGDASILGIVLISSVLSMVYPRFLA